jgi:hypothetical protein
MEGREGGQHAAASGVAGRMRSSSLSSSGVLMQKLGLPVATTRLQMFHVADAGNSYKGGRRRWARASSSVGYARSRMMPPPVSSW